MNFARTHEQALELERKFNDIRGDGQIPTQAQWMEVHWTRIQLYELVIDAIGECSYLQVVRLGFIAARVKAKKYTLDPAADQFTEKLSA